MADVAQLWMLYVIAFALGIGETLFDTAAQSIMPMLVKHDDLSRANGRLYAVELTMNQFVGPPLGGLLVGTAMALAFVGSALAYVVGFLALVAMAGTYRVARTRTADQAAHRHRRRAQVPLPPPCAAHVRGDDRHRQPGEHRHVLACSRSMPSLPVRSD